MPPKEHNKLPVTNPEKETSMRRLIENNDFKETRQTRREQG